MKGPAREMPDEEYCATRLLDYLAECDRLEAELVAARKWRNDFVAELRKERWTLQRIAEHTGRTKQTIAQWLS